jgi:tRNA threonylcarbamoyl adenosine modification protein YeaZ
MRILVLDSALARCTAAIVVDDAVMASRAEDRKQGHEAVLPVMARDVLDEAGAARGNGPRGSGSGRSDLALDLVAVTVGPGSFTGIRAGLALAHGLGLALGLPVVGVTVGEAIADAFPRLGDRVLWTVTDSRRGHIFLERGGEIASLALEALPSPAGKVAIAGGAAMQVAARLAGKGANVMLTDARFALPRHIALVAARRHAGALRPREAQPLYVDPPEARLPAAGLRPPPDPAGR